MGGERWHRGERGVGVGWGRGGRFISDFPYLLYQRVKWGSLKLSEFI